MEHPYLSECTARIERVSAQAEAIFGKLNEAQLNWKPNPDQWSVGQCLHHLMTSNNTYFSVFDSIFDGTKRSTFWEKIPILPKWWGKFLIKALDPANTKKSRTFPVFEPTQSAVPATIVAEFVAHNARLLQYIARLDALNLSSIIITSPAASFVTYSLRDTIFILTNHEERHYLQARRVMEGSEFPYLIE